MVYHVTCSLPSSPSDLNLVHQTIFRVRIRAGYETTPEEVGHDFCGMHI